jgi:hypothetical protein
LWYLTRFDFGACVTSSVNSHRWDSWGGPTTFVVSVICMCGGVAFCGWAIYFLVGLLLSGPKTCPMGEMKACPGGGIQFCQRDHWTVCYDLKVHSYFSDQDKSKFNP